MTEITAGAFTFRFPPAADATRYDEWSFHRYQFQAVAGGCKAVDVLCLTGDTAWLLEIKDYRRHPRTKPIEIADEVATKVRDTLAGLAAAATQANDDDERRRARRALASRRRWRVVLHLEQPVNLSRLRPTPVDAASILTKLRSRNLKAVDPHPEIVSRDAPSPRVPWTVR